MKNLLQILFLLFSAHLTAQTVIVGGGNMCKVNGDPDLNANLATQDQRYECSIAWDTLNNKFYTYRASDPAGSRWDELTVSGASYTAGTGISIDGAGVISNTGDPSSTNELQALNVASNTVNLTGGVSQFTIAGAGGITASTAGSTITLTGTVPTGNETKVNGSAGIGVAGAGTIASPYALTNLGDIDGSGTKMVAGANVTISGLGTVGSPYNISSTGGGGGSISGPALEAFVGTGSSYVTSPALVASSTQVGIRNGSGTLTGHLKIGDASVFGKVGDYVFDVNSSSNYRVLYNITDSAATVNVNNASRDYQITGTVGNRFKVGNNGGALFGRDGQPTTVQIPGTTGLRHSILSATSVSARSTGQSYVFASNAKGQPLYRSSMSSTGLEIEMNYTDLVGVDTTKYDEWYSFHDRVKSGGYRYRGINQIFKETRNGFDISSFINGTIVFKARTAPIDLAANPDLGDIPAAMAIDTVLGSLGGIVTIGGSLAYNTSPLEIRGDAISNIIPTLKLMSTQPSMAPSIGFAYDSTAGSTSKPHSQIVARPLSLGPITSEMQFMVSDSGIMRKQAVLSKQGWWGIGLAAPLAPLHVNNKRFVGSAANTSLIIEAPVFGFGPDKNFIGFRASTSPTVDLAKIGINSGYGIEIHALDGSDQTNAVFAGTGGVTFPRAPTRVAETDIWYKGSGGTHASGPFSLGIIPQSSATTGQAIVWNGTAWAPGTVSGGGGGVPGVGSAGKFTYWRTSNNLSFSPLMDVDSANVRVSFGRTAPAATVHIKGNSILAANTAFQVDDSRNTATLAVNNKGQVGFGKSDTLFTNAAYASLIPQAAGFGGTITLQNSSGADITQAVSLLSGSLVYTGANGYTVGRGMQFNVLNQSTATTNAITGIYAAARGSGASSRAASYTGFLADAFTQQTGGTVATMASFNSGNLGTTGAGSTLTSVYGLKVNDVLNSGTITNTYGVHIGDITTGTQTNTAYSFLATDPNARNGFSGNTMVGGTATGTAARALHVNGEMRVSDMTTDAPTNLAGYDADGDFGGVALGTGLSITSGTLNYTPSVGTYYQTFIYNTSTPFSQRGAANFVPTPTITIALQDDPGNNETEVRAAVNSGSITTTEIANNTVSPTDLAPVVTASSCTNCDLTYNASGQIVSATNGTAASVALSAITDATGTNTIDSDNFTQTWNWSTADNETPMVFTANALTTGTLQQFSSSNNSLNSTEGIVTVKNNGTSTSGAVFSVFANSTAGRGLYVRANGRVGVNRTDPISTLNVNGVGYFGSSRLPSIESTLVGGVDSSDFRYSTSIENRMNTSGAHATLYAKVGGTSGGDPATIYDVPGGASWSVGIDNSDGDRLKFSANQSVGTTSVLEMLSSGVSAVVLDRTVTSGGTTGAQTINKMAGTVNFAAGASTLVVTNSLVTTSSIIIPVVRTNDTTATIKNIVAASGSFTITLTAAATAETSVGFAVFN